MGEDGWQPIETAPRDGRVALCWKPRPTSSYDDDFGHTIMIMDVEPERLALWGYTHWRPLPAPPEGASDVR